MNEPENNALPYIAEHEVLSTNKGQVCPKTPKWPGRLLALMVELYSIFGDEDSNEPPRGNKASQTPGTNQTLKW